MTHGNLMAKVGAWAFIVGVILALITGFMAKSAVITASLVVLGLIVGFLNVTDRETTPFLMASVAIMIALYTAGQSMIGDMITLGQVGVVMIRILASINTFVFPATVVVALKAIYALAQDA